MLIRPIRAIRVLFPLALAVGTAGPACAQAAADRVYPPGGQRGATVSLTFPGFDKIDSAELVIAGDGIAAAGPFLKGVGQLRIAPDAQPGVRHLRLVGPKSATEWRPFAIGVLPEALEKEPNDSRDKAQLLEQLPVTLNGAIPKPTDADNYRVALKQGQCLVIASESRKLAGPVYLALIVRDARGRRLPVTVDQRRRDPVFTCAVPADGEYFLQFSDVTSNLGTIDEGCQYRLHLTVGPWLDFVTPPTAVKGGTARLTAHGWNLGGKTGPGTAVLDQAVPSETGNELQVSAAGSPNTVPLRLTGSPTLPEAEPNDTAATAQSLVVPASVHGEFARRGDRDVYRFEVKAKDVLRIDVDAREWDSLGDPRFVLRDAAGKVLLTVDDSDRTRDPREVWTVPADGAYTVTLEDLGGTLRSGPSAFYRLSIAPPAPEMALTATSTRLEIKPGAKVEWSFMLQQSYQPDEVALRLEGLPAGVTAEGVRTPSLGKRSGQTTIKFTVTAAADAKAGYGVVQVIAETAIGRSTVATWTHTGDGNISLGIPTVDRLLVHLPAP